MATNIFKLVGEVSVNMNSFNTSMDAALTKVNNLATALNNLNGTHATVTVNQTGAGVPTVAGGSASSSTGSTGNTTGSGTQSGTGSSGDAGSGGTMVVAPGSDGWTVGKGVVSSWLASAGKWAFDKVVDQLEAGWERNKTEAIFAERLGMFTGLDGSEAWQFVEKINQFAYDTPLNVEDAWNVATQLLNYGVLQEDLIDTLWMLGDMTLGDNTKMTALAKAYTDLLGKEMLYAEEGRQFTNIIPLWDMLETYYASDGYNGPYKGYDALTIKGGLNKSVFVTAEDVTAAFKMATAEGGRYYNAMARIMGTQFGQEQLLDENMTNIAAAFVEPFQKIYTKDLLPGLVALTTMMNDILNPEMTEFRMAYNDLVDKGVFSFSNVDTPVGMRLFDALGSSGDQTSDNDRWKYTRGWLGGVWDSFLNGDFLFSNWFAKEEAEPEPEIVLPTKEELDMRRRTKNSVKPIGGGPGDANTIFFDDGHRFLPGATGASSVFTQFNNMPNQITAAVREGFNGATVTVNVTTGDVRLNEGTLVGSLAPRVDAILGAWNARAARG